MATDHNFIVKNGLEVGGVLIINSSGQLQAVTATGPIALNDSVQLRFGNDLDLRIAHDGTNSTVDNYTGHLDIKNHSKN